jgi:hypothetical protein
MLLNPQHREKVEQLLRAVDTSALPPGQLSGSDSDKLADFLWMCNEHDLSEGKEEPLSKLAAEQPVAVGFSKASLSGIIKQEAASLDGLIERVLLRYVEKGKLPATSFPFTPSTLHRRLSQLPSRVKSLTQFVANLSVEVARDFPRTSQCCPPALGTSSVQISTERATTLVQSLLKRVGFLENTFDHACNGLCQITVQVVEPSRNRPVPTTLALVNRGQDRFRGSQIFESLAGRIPALSPGDLAVVIDGHHGEVQRIYASLSPLQER